VKYLRDINRLKNLNKYLKVIVIPPSIRIYGIINKFCQLKEEGGQSSR
jgi:hypothetical protein